MHQKAIEIADYMEERISELEDRNLEMIQVEEKRELRSTKKIQKLSELSDSIKKGSII